MLGHVKLLLATETMDHIKKLYSYLTKKDTILTRILQEIVKNN